MCKNKLFSIWQPSFPPEEVNIEILVRVVGKIGTANKENIYFADHVRLDYFFLSELFFDIKN